MGMFDSFFFEKGLLPENKVEDGHEFQTKSLDCQLDEYRVYANGTVRKFVYGGHDASRVEDTEPINVTAEVYSYEFLYDNEDILNRKYLGTRFQEYIVVIAGSRLFSAKKVLEYGYK